jgi:hypothetical protein
VYEAHFTARAEHYTDHDRRTADARTATLVTALLRALARPFRPPGRPSGARPQPVDACRQVAADCR